MATYSMPIIPDQEDPGRPRMTDFLGVTGDLGQYRGRDVNLTDPLLVERLKQLQDVRDFLYGNIEDRTKQSQKDQNTFEALANMFSTAGGVQKGSLPSANNFININDRAKQDLNRLDYNVVGSEEDTFNALTNAARQARQDTMGEEQKDYERARSKYDPTILVGADGKPQYARYNKDTSSYEDLQGNVIDNPRPVGKSGEYELKELDDGTVAIFNKNTGGLVTGQTGGAGMSKELRKKAADDQAALYGQVVDAQDTAALADRYVNALDRLNKDSIIGSGPLDSAINSTVGSINQVLGTNMLDTKQRQEVAAYQKQLELKAAQLSMKGQGAITEGERALLSQSLGNMGDPAVAKKVAEIIKQNAERSSRMASDWDEARKNGEKDFYSWRTQWMKQNSGPKGSTTQKGELPSDAKAMGGGYYYSPSTGKYYKGE